MPSATRAIIRGTEIVRGDGTNRVKETIVVEGLDATEDERLLWDALTSSEVPQPGDFHRFVPLCRCKEVVGVRALSTTSVELVAYFETVQRPGGNEGGASRKWIIEKQNALVTVTSQVDRDGKPTIVRYKPPTGRKEIKKTGTYTYQMPMTTVKASKVIQGAPPAAWDAAVGKVNGAPWEGAEKGQVLFMGVNSITKDDGRTYGVTLTFLKNPEGWGAVVVYKDPSGNVAHIAPADAKMVKDGKYTEVDRNGILRVLPYKEFNPGQLGL